MLGSTSRSFRPLLWPSLAVLALAARAGRADEVLVFKRDSPFKGASMRVASYEEKNGRLLLHTAKGEVFSAAKDSVDWAASKDATARIQKEDAAFAAKQAEEEQARLAAARKAEAKKPETSLVQASRRYGVEKPGMSVAAGTAAKPVAAPAPEAAAGGARPGAEPAKGGGGGKESAEVKGAKDKIAAAKAERDKLLKDIDALRKDNNPDPLVAAQRSSRLQEKEAQLTDLDKKISSLEADLDKLQKKAEEASKPSGGK